MTCMRKEVCNNANERFVLFLLWEGVYSVSSVFNPDKRAVRASTFDLESTHM